MRKRTLTSGAMLAALLFTTANTSFAQTTSPTTHAVRTGSKMHRLHWSLSDSALAELATKLGLNADVIANEIKSGKSIQQVLRDHGVTPAQIQSVFGQIKPKELKNFKLTDAEIASLATKLNINADTIKQEIAAGKTVKEILTAHGITPAKLHTVFENKKIHKTGMKRSGAQKTTS